MLISRPDYYKEFQCVADACEDTCCAGWQIVVDEQKLKKYKKAVRDRRLSVSFRKQLKKGVDWKEGCFYQSKERRCAFLNEKNLCDLYTNLGKENLCTTCRRYPRHVEEFENVREISLSLSCPEVARILMTHMDKVTFQQVELEKEEEYDEFDVFLYSQLLDARNVMFAILQDRTLDLDVRQRLIYGIAHDMQNRIRRGEMFACAEVTEKYGTEKAREFVEKTLEAELQDGEAVFQFRKQTFRKMFQLELLKQEWDVQLLEVERFLYLGHTAEEYSNVSLCFQSWMEEQDIPWEIQKEQILVYFIYTYFCGAIYDEEILPKVGMALMAGEVIEEILKARWLKNGGSLQLEEIIEVVYRFSREVEHSDENLKRMEELNRDYLEE